MIWYEQKKSYTNDFFLCLFQLFRLISIFLFKVYDNNWIWWSKQNRLYLFPEYIWSKYYVYFLKVFWICLSLFCYFHLVRPDVSIITNHWKHHFRWRNSKKKKNQSMHPNVRINADYKCRQCGCLYFRVNVRLDEIFHCTNCHRSLLPTAQV